MKKFKLEKFLQNFLHALSVHSYWGGIQHMLPTFALCYITPYAHSSKFHFVLPYLGSLLYLVVGPISSFTIVSRVVDNKISRYFLFVAWVIWFFQGIDLMLILPICVSYLYFNLGIPIYLVILHTLTVGILYSYAGIRFAKKMRKKLGKDTTFRILLEEELD